MISTQLPVYETRLYANSSIEKLEEIKLGLEEKRTKFLKDKGLQKLDFCLDIIDRLGLVLVIGVPVALAFVVSPWMLLTAPVILAAWGIAGVVRHRWCGISATKGPHLQDYKESLARRDLPSGESLVRKVELYKAHLSDRTQFFRDKKEYLTEQEEQKNDERQNDHGNTLKSIAHLFSSLNHLEKENYLNSFEISVRRSKNCLNNSSLPSKERDVFSILLNKIESNPDEIKQKISEMRKTKTLSQDALMDYISTLPRKLGSS